MAAPKSPRKGSLQYWPRKRASKFLPRVNWGAINSDKSIQGFICYKAGMASAYVKDNTPDSMTKGKNIIVPITILACPNVKIFSVRFYKGNHLIKEILSESLDKELKKKVKLPKTKAKFGDIKEDYDNIRVVIYTQPKKADIKKTPDLSEVALSGSKEEKLNFVREKINKEISVADIFKNNDLVDIRGLTKGKGLVGPVKRFGLTLKSHKSEKGVRRPGSLGPWHPARVTFRAPISGQLGMFTRVSLNSKIVKVGKSDDGLKNIKNFGDIKTDYVLVSGSVPGTAKRQLLLTASLRPTKKQKKRAYDFLELR